MALLLLAFFATASFAASQTVWKWTDDNGVTHYSDRAVPGATRMEIRSSNRTDGPRPSYSQSAPPQQDQDEGPAYRNFEIWKPAAGEAFINTGGVVPVNVRVDPTLQAGHDLHLYLDGRLVEGFPPSTTTYELTQVPRGTHSVVAVISDRRGKRIQESAAVSFVVRQESIANPPVGPALRPPPKPRPGGSANKLPTQQPSFADLNGARAPIDPSTNAPRKQAPAKTLPAPAKNAG